MNKQMPPAMKMLIIIVDRKRAGEVSDALRKSGVHAHYQFRGEGTASSEVLDLLGLDGTEKIVTLCLAPQFAMRQLLRETAAALDLRRPGKGVAFSVPLNGIGSPAFKMLNKEMRQLVADHIESEGEKMTNTATHDLIMVFSNRGSSDDVMEAAKEAGATGGTIVNARRMGLEEPMKLWGITVQDEKEIVLIVTRKEDKVNIMRAVGKHCGLDSEAQAMAISLPVDGIAGFPEPRQGKED